MNGSLTPSNTAGHRQSRGRTVGGRLDATARQAGLPDETIRPGVSCHPRAVGERAKKTGIVGHRPASTSRGLLDAFTTLPYVVQTWNFDQLAMVFRPKSSITRRLKKEFDSARLWVNAYANDVPCCIAAHPRRATTKPGLVVVLRSAGRLAPETELIQSRARLLKFLVDPKKAGSPAKSPEESMASCASLTENWSGRSRALGGRSGIDWSADGNGRGNACSRWPGWAMKPGGREGVGGPGRRWRTKATVFLDEIRPTGITAGKGVLVCTAPDILCTEDRNGDGRADASKVVQRIATEIMAQ